MIRNRGVRLAMAAFALPLLGTASPQAAGAQQRPAIQVAIDVTRTGDPIDPLLYGHFVELFKHWFEAGVWAEMVGDRKFYHPVNNQPQGAPNSRSQFGVGRWWTVGPEDRIVPDSTRAYAGDHSPKILLDPSTPHGIRQPGIGVRRDQPGGYTGRIVLAGDPTARIEVSLTWGPDPEDRQSVTIPSITTDYRTYPLTFSVGADTTDGELRITGTGTGSFLIGAVSLMPADNVEGFHRGVLEVVRQMHPTMLRWGGNFSANYEWRDGIGDRDRRPPQWDFAWDAIESHDVGTLEILALNRLLGSEPNIGVNAGLGDAYSAGLWVEYVNGSVDTPMGRLRAEHGHPEPFGVRWWGVGNEMYGRWQLGHMSIDQYIIKHNQFAKRMRAVDPSIALVASGASRYQMSADSRDRPFTDGNGEVVMPPFEIGSEQDWSGRLLTDAYQNFDYLAEHIYGTGNFAYDLETQTWPGLTDVALQDEVRRVPNRIRGMVEAWEEYQQRMPWLENTDIRVVMDEWAAGGGEVVRALWTAMVMNEMFRHTDVFKMSAQTGFRRCFDHDRYGAPQLRACGLLFKLYRERFGTVPVQVDGDSPQPELPGTIGVDKPRVSSGSPTYPLDVVAALSEDGASLTVAVVNPSESGQTFWLDLAGAGLPDRGRVWTIAPPSLEAQNLAGQEPEILLVESSVGNASEPLTAEPLSISVYEFEIE